MTTMTSANAQILTIPGLFEATVSCRPDSPALGVIEQGQLCWQTWGDLAEKVYARAADLVARGVRPGDRVAQLAPNSEGWILADLAIQSVGAVHVPMHISLSQTQVAQQVAHCAAKVIITGTQECAECIRPELDSAVTLVSHDELGQKCKSVTVPRNRPPKPDDLATILYTSGTTGPPRGVMLSQQNVAVNVVSTAEELATDDDEIRLLILPLSHIYARTCDLYCWIYRGTRLVIAESRETALRDCQLARPTVLNAVPYFYQKLADGMRAASEQADASMLGAALGGAIKMLFCGGAPLAPDADRFFAERGMPILCGYGLTESSPVITASRPGEYTAGTVGRPLPDVEVRLADDGEILVRGPNVMLGYWENPAETARALEDGWLHTGDLGSWAAGGQLKIVGRKKEMIVLATGKKVAPTVIENLLAGSPLIEQCCVLGEGRKYLGALIVPKSDRAADGTTAALFRQEIDCRLAGLAEFEQVGVFTLLDRPFSIDLGEVTPKLSLCRKVIERNFAQEIEAMYTCEQQSWEGTAQLATNSLSLEGRN
jgi:long-chain acyl-CoA synthetase